MHRWFVQNLCITEGQTLVSFPGELKQNQHMTIHRTSTSRVKRHSLRPILGTTKTRQFRGIWQLHGDLRKSSLCTNTAQAALLPKDSSGKPLLETSDQATVTQSLASPWDSGKLTSFALTQHRRINATQPDSNTSLGMTETCLSLSGDDGEKLILW